MKMNVTVTKIEENPSLPKGISEVPDDYKIQDFDLDNINKMMEDAAGKQ